MSAQTESTLKAPLTLLSLLSQVAQEVEQAAQMVEGCGTREELEKIALEIGLLRDLIVGSHDPGAGEAAPTTSAHAPAKQDDARRPAHLGPPRHEATLENNRKRGGTTMTQHLDEFKPRRPIPAQRRDWPLLIGVAKERAEQWLRDQRALEEDVDAIARGETRAALKAAYVAGYLAGVQQGSAARVPKHPFCHDGKEPQYGGGG